jgi:dihydropteroate synthase
MQYHEAADYLESLQRHRPKLGVETTARMLSHLGDPQEGADVVQVAGSNGKGSTARMVESVLRAEGLDVGLFTSPGLVDFRDQITVNGGRIPKDRVSAFVETMDPCLERLAADDDTPTHFEVITALALYHFGAEDVDVAVLEVGIGGRYDATSATDPVASAVTSVSLEHTDLLGDTVEEIARDKAQVAPAGAPLVTGATGPALEAIREVTDVVTVGGEGADVRAVETGMRSDVESHVSITGPDWALETSLSLLGAHQATNAGVAATLARQVADVDTATVADGLRAATWPGRFETVATDPRVVLDGSHNPGAAATLGGLLDRYDYEDLHVVFGAMADKDHDGMVAQLPPVETVLATRPDLDRAADLDTLVDAFAGRSARVERVPSVAAAVERALATADPADFVLVTGSLYVVAEARDRWTRRLVPRDRHPAGSLAAVRSGAVFPETTAEDLDHRLFTTYLRADQARQVARRLDAAGGACHRSTAGAPGKYVATVLSGTVTQLRALAEALDDDGFGLAHVGDQVRAALDGGAGAPFGGERGSEGAASAGDGPNASPGAGGTALMGILDVAPGEPRDGRSDGGRGADVDAAAARADEMVAAGADVVDVSLARSGGDPLSVEAARARVVPVVEAIADLDARISVDTHRAAVADAALAAGADVVRDVSGLGDPEMRFVVADHDASIVLAHSLSAPGQSGRTVIYDDVVEDVLRDLSERAIRAERAGLDREQVLVDPGLGLGKDAAESVELVDRLGELRALGCPVVVGHSGASMFERAGRAGEELAPTLAVTAMAAERGADVVRVQNVAENAAVLRTTAATDGR